MHHRLGLVVLAATAAAVAPATAGAATQQVKLRFAAVAGSTSVSCGATIPGLGTTRADAQLLDLRFFASDVRLHKANGKSVRVKLARNAFQTTKGRHGVTLIDLEDGTGACEDGTPRTNALVRGTVPKGRYTGASWTVGVPFALNHTDAPTAAAPLNSTAMAWSWQVGRKFTKIEVGAPAPRRRARGRRRRSSSTSAAPAARATPPPGRRSSAPPGTGRRSASPG